MTKILKEIKAYETVVDGVTPAEDADATEVEAFDYLCHTASTIFIHVVLQDNLEKIVELEKPHLMWTWLRTKYYRDSAYALVSQIMRLVSLSTHYSRSGLSDFTTNFKSQLLHLTKLLKGSSDLYQKSFASFIDDNKAKRDCSWGFLVKHCKNEVDNLTTKDSLSYADVKQ